MKKFITFSLIIIALLFCYQKRENIFDFIIYNFVIDKNIILKNTNDYKIDYQLVNTETDFIANNYNEMITIIYNTLNNGWNEFNFYCNIEYKSCIDDLKKIINDQSILPNMNNLVHPFNSYKQINITYNNYGEIKVDIDKLYSDEDINTINNKINNIYNRIIGNETNTTKKIEKIHDYIVNNSIYDTTKADFISNISNIDSTYKSNIAYGPLIEGYGICSGYTDLMAIFLNKMNIPNYKLASENHTWNYVYINNKWLHLDLTWDDPVVADGKNYLLHDMFLIDSNKLNKLDKKEHNYKDNILITKK